MRPLAGIFPPITTPFDHDGELLLDKWRENLDRWAAFDLAGYTVLGSNGESPYLSEQEKSTLLREARSRIPRDKTMIAGAGRESTRLSMQAVRQAADLGADCALVGAPCYFKGSMTADALFAHYWSVADEAPVPIVLYNAPQFTGVFLSADLIEKLSAHENIAAMKDSSGNLGFQLEVRRRTPARFQLLTGSASTLLPSLIQGASGGVIAAACAFPTLTLQLYEAFRAGEWQQAAGLQTGLASLAAAATGRFGIAGLKAAMDLTGFYGGPPRLPLLSLNDAQKATLISTFQAAGVLEAAHIV